MLCPAELATAITAAAIALAEGRSSEEVGLLAAVFAQLGDTLATIALQQSLCEAANKSNSSQSQDS